MRVVATLRNLFVITLVIGLILLLVIPSTSFARKEARYEIISGNVIAGLDHGQANDKQNLFHQQTLQSADIESLNIAFTSPGLNGGASTANVLPFGETNLALPSIAQNNGQSCSATSTGFYSATFLGIPPVNTGAALVESGPYRAVSPTLPSSSIAGPNMPFPEMIDSTPGTDRSKAIADATKKDNSTSTNKTKSLESIPLNTGNI